MLAVIRHLDLLRVGVAYSRHSIRVNNAARQVVRVAIGLQLVRRKVGGIEARDVLDRLHIPDSLEKRIVLEGIVQEHGHQSCLPVVAVDDVRAEIQGGQSGNSRFGEECEFLNVLIDISIGLGPCEIVFIVNEIECDRPLKGALPGGILEQLAMSMCHESFTMLWRSFISLIRSRLNFTS